MGIFRTVKESPKHETSLHPLIRDAVVKLSGLTQGISIKHQVEGTSNTGNLISDIAVDVNGVKLSIGGEITQEDAAKFLKAQPIVREQEVSPIKQRRELRISNIQRRLVQIEGAYTKGITLLNPGATMTPSLQKVKVDHPDTKLIHDAILNILPDELKDANLHVMSDDGKWKFVLTHSIPTSQLSAKEKERFGRVQTLRAEVAQLNAPLVKALKLPTNELLSGPVANHHRTVVVIDGEHYVHDLIRYRHFKPKTEGLSQEDAIRQVLSTAGFKGEVKIDKTLEGIFISATTPIKLNKLDSTVAGSVRVAGEAYRDLCHEISRLERPWLYIKRDNEAERFGLQERIEAIPVTAPKPLPVITTLARKIKAATDSAQYTDTTLKLDLVPGGAVLNGTVRFTAAQARALTGRRDEDDISAALPAAFNTTTQRAAKDCHVTCEKTDSGWAVKISKRFDHNSLEPAELKVLADAARNHAINRDAHEDIMFHISPEIDRAREMISHLARRLTTSKMGFEVNSATSARVTLVAPKGKGTIEASKFNDLINKYGLTGRVDFKRSDSSDTIKVDFNLSGANKPLIVRAAKAKDAFDRYRKVLEVPGVLTLGSVTV